jgi:hypothetical protein
MQHGPGWLRLLIIGLDMLSLGKEWRRGVTGGEPFGMRVSEVVGAMLIIGCDEGCASVAQTLRVSLFWS